MKVELKYVIKEDGEPFVTVGGAVLKLPSCVDNLDIRVKVRVKLPII